MEIRTLRNIFLVSLAGTLASCAAPLPPTVVASPTVRLPQSGIATPTIQSRFGQVRTIDASADRKPFWQKVYQDAEPYCPLPTPGVSIVQIAPGQNLTTSEGNPVASLYIPPTTPGEQPKIAVLENPRWFGDDAFARDSKATLEQVAKATEAIGIVEEEVHGCTPDFTGDPFTQEPFIVYKDPTTYIDGPTGKPYEGTISIYSRQKLDMVLKLTERYQDGTIKEKKFSEAGNTEELITGWARRKIVNEIFGPDSLEAKISNQTTYYLPGIRAMDNLFQAAQADLRTVLKAKQTRDIKTIFGMLSDGLVAVGEANGIKTTSSKKNDSASQFMLYNVVSKLSSPGTEREIPSQVLVSIFSDLSQFYYGKEFVKLNNEEQQKIVTVMNSLLKESTKKTSGILPSQTPFIINDREYYIIDETLVGTMQLVRREDYIRMLLSELTPGFRYEPQEIITARRMADNVFVVAPNNFL